MILNAAAEITAVRRRKTVTITIQQKPHKQFNSARTHVCNASYHSCILNHAVIFHLHSCVFTSNFSINNKLIIMLMPSDVADNKNPMVQNSHCGELR